MADSVLQRRQPPSPLIFSPDTVLTSPANSSQSTANQNINASTSNTVSMPFVRRHVTRHLKTAKQECDKELQRVTNSITAFFEGFLRDGDHDALNDRDRDLRESRQSMHIADLDHQRDPYTFQPADLRSALQQEEYNSDSGHDAEWEYSNRHSRQPSSSSSMGPAPMRRQHSAAWDRPLSSSISSSTVSSSPANSTIMLPEAPLTRKQPASSSNPQSSWPNQPPNRRLSRTIHTASSRPTTSGRSSRSNSRSRSPLPPLQSHASFSEYSTGLPPGHLSSSTSSTANRRSSRIMLDEPVDPIMTALYELIAVATEVIDMSISQLTSQPKLCESLVQRIQNIGRAWDEHPDWHGRNWYVQVLLAVASLSRVVEWWEAEKQFWNFDDTGGDQGDRDEEPLLFVMKPAEEPDPSMLQPSFIPPKSGTLPQRTPGDELEHFKLNPEEESKLKMTKTVSQNRRQRSEHKESPPKDSRVPPSKLIDHTESARVLATERLRLQAETAQNQNIVLELSLDGDHIIWVNHAWGVVVGTNADEVPGTRISPFVYPPDSHVFLDATRHLLEDDSHTIEAKFRLRIEPEDNAFTPAGPPGHLLYQTMEGQGMLVSDREEGPTHTMWVVKPIGTPRWEVDIPSPLSALHEQHQEGADNAVEQGSIPHEGDLSIVTENTETTDFEGPPTGSAATGTAINFPFPLPISIEPILCRICECQIPQWYFEKHSETCAETHRLEAEIMECNESIAELRSKVRDLAVAIESNSPVTSPAAEYRGMPLFSPSTSPSVSSPLQLFRAGKMQRIGVKKMQKRLLDQLEDILQVASEVSVPSLKEEEAKEPIERQRLLSPSSERKMSQIRNWSKPQTEDAALGQLVMDTERVMRQKMDNVVRMQNTIRYSEKIWHEWEDKVGAYLQTVEDDECSSEECSGSESGESDEEDIVAPVAESRYISQDVVRHPEESEDGYSSTTSEYAFNGESNHVSPDPTPMASSSPIPSNNASEFRLPPAQQSMPPPTSYPSRQPLHTRSSTPSSVSSPLALAAPIVASSSLDQLITQLPQDERSLSPQVKPRKSSQSLLEPKFIVTPPASPMLTARDGPGLQREPSQKRGHRRHSTINPTMSPGPLSPRQPSAPPLARTSPTSIKDFDVIKPISKGAFGSVFLAKKKITGDYYAIKVLKKADMIAKNQITNVKAERMILMKQAESPFVAKLYFTFQSKENLYLVMEYLNGGDCAALIKSLGSLPEEWTKNYIAEVTLGLEYLHQRGVVHRDLKPDNLLIDQHGHLKLTDFGLSRIGLLGRQNRESQIGRPHTRYSSRSRPPSMDSAYLSSPLIVNDSGGSYFAQRPTAVPRTGNIPYSLPTDETYDSSGAENIPSILSRRRPKSDSPMQSFATELTTDLRSHSHSSSSAGNTPPGEQKFVGTPDYLAPETILGLRGDDAAVDWWALGVITYEFLYGIPPFHAETPEKVFENILSGHIEWHEDWVDFTEEARDFMQRLMTVEPTQRLGANGADEVKNHAWFDEIDWDTVTTREAQFIPKVTDPESTDYFDPRGAIPQLFHDDDLMVAQPGPSALNSPVVDNAGPSHFLPVPVAPQAQTGTPGDENFGSFSFKNLPVLKQANDDVIRKFKTDQMAPMTQAMVESTSAAHARRRSMSHRLKKPPSVVTSTDPKNMPTNPPSPATSTSSIASSPSRASLPPSAPGSATHTRKPSEYGAIERFKQSHMDDRRNSMPSRLRTASVSSVGDGSGSETWNSSAGHGSTNTPPSSVHSIDLRKGPDPNDRAVTCLLAEDNPITAKIIETLLIRLGCRVVVVSDGSEAISVAMGDIKFDCILMDLHMPVLDGEGAAKYIKSTNSKNTNTPIIAVSAYSGNDPNEESNVFSASLSKPLQKADLIAALRKLGFKTTAMPGAGATKLIASNYS